MNEVIISEALLQIINEYGVLPQLKYFQSEVFELNETIINAENNRLIGIGREPSETAIKHITEEIADVLVMLNQFILYYEIPMSDIDKIAVEKIKRQLNRIIEKNEN